MSQPDSTFFKVVTGTVRGTISDYGGFERFVSFHAVVVPGMGANLFSVTEAMRKGDATIFHPDKPRLEVEDIVLPMNMLGADERTGKLLCSIKGAWLCHRWVRFAS